MKFIGLIFYSLAVVLTAFNHLYQWRDINHRATWGGEARYLFVHISMICVLRTCRFRNRAYGRRISPPLRGWLIVLGARKRLKLRSGWQVNAIPGCKPTMRALGTFILWRVWFGLQRGFSISNCKRWKCQQCRSCSSLNTNMGRLAGGWFAAIATLQD